MDPERPPTNRYAEDPFGLQVDWPDLQSPASPDASRDTSDAAADDDPAPEPADAGLGVENRTGDSPPSDEESAAPVAAEVVQEAAQAQAAEEVATESAEDAESEPEPEPDPAAIDAEVTEVPLTDAPPSFEEQAPPPAGDYPSLTGTYRVLRRHDRRGITRISVAETVGGSPVRIVEFDGDERGDRMTRRLREFSASGCPCCVQIVEVGPTDRGWVCVEDHGDWRSLREILVESGPLGGSGLKVLGVQLVRALDCLRSVGFLHRNLSPESILANEDLSEIRLRGFELAIKPPMGEEVRSLAGNPCYMAPEASDHRAGFASDLYSVGATLFELASGRPPFRVETVEGLRRQLVRRPMPKPSDFQSSVSADIDAIVLQAMHPDPSRRSLDFGHVEGAG